VIPFPHTKRKVNPPPSKKPKQTKTHDLGEVLVLSDSTEQCHWTSRGEEDGEMVSE